ncbi:TetR family transcriptional regulator [Nitrosomonas sp. JL21]|uniref:TetR/AcrR family transcriptional regulator n=1 Tax=Nitrosomonas sp. JL21 TaxID=153949 RepID=UPI0013689453|nr:TetR/AcrR family transcriptional regulator [Nitrosomonas sp. JL21]MBL8496670.1 TetR family transcriptional regulator C-terminal domain-containing protein [Nitrosomonas sp.]MCC7091804.1 TetR family transcriptional regulator C-terminal domain-containing protein [Nitrosomonas sp.]MXS76416.1 TetR family transcriptional regulator [Nitrosomonas sp. JL21]
MSKLNKKDSNRESLLNQGVTFFMHQGYHGTGLQEILNAVKVPKGSFYNYFESKEEFGAAVIQHYVEPFISKLSMHLQRSDSDALSAIRRYFDELAVELEENKFKGGCLLGNLMGEIGSTSDACQQSLQSAIRRYRDVLQSGLAQAQRQGSVRLDKSAEEMADLLINTWQGALLRMQIEKSSAPVKQCCHDLLDDFFLR